MWERLERGLYGPVGVPKHWRRTVMAAVLVAPRGALASHRAGARLLDVGGLDDPIPELTIPRGSSFRRPGVITHESTDLDLADRCIIDGIPVTGPCRLAMDLGAVVSPARYAQTVRELRFGLGVSKEDLLRTYLRHKRRGRDGGGALRAWLDRYFHVEGVPESGLEQLVLDAILDAAMHPPVLQLWVEAYGNRYRLDMAYPDLMIAIEIDGRQHAEDAEISANDRIRQQALKRLGWTILRIRSRHLATDLAAALTHLRSVV